MGSKGSHNDIELPFRDGLTLLVRLLVHCLLVYIHMYNVIFLPCGLTLWLARALIAHRVKCSHIGGVSFI